jgi:hypothetical protein
VGVLRMFKNRKITTKLNRVLLIECLAWWGLFADESVGLDASLQGRDSSGGTRRRVPRPTMTCSAHVSGTPKVHVMGDC